MVLFKKVKNLSIPSTFNRVSGNVLQFIIKLRILICKNIFSGNIQIQAISLYIFSLLKMILY